MALPIPGHPVDLAFGVKGKNWSCGWHGGVDFKVPVGTDYYAPIDGVIVKVGQCWGAAYGQHAVLMKITVGEHAGKHLVFGHGSSFAVSAGQVVSKGTLLGKTGAEGNVTGPHLHVEMQKGPGWAKGGGLDLAAVLAAQPIVQESCGCNDRTTSYCQPSVSRCCQQ